MLQIEGKPFLVAFFVIRHGWLGGQQNQGIRLESLIDLPPDLPLDISAITKDIKSLPAKELIDLLGDGDVLFAYEIKILLMACLGASPSIRVISLFLVQCWFLRRPLRIIPMASTGGTTESGR
jgi:hypothetical protein